MKKLLASVLFASALVAAPAQAALIGPSPYLSQADSPFNPAAFDYFYLEDLEDNAINTPGLTVTGPSICITGFNCFVGGGVTDSVGNGGNGQLGRSIFTNGSADIVFSFAELGSLPTAAGLVWTDGNNPIRFEAFDQNNVSLGVLMGNHAVDGQFTGQTAEDRFYGATNAGGILRMVISNTPGTEIDHIQYGGVGAIPEPATWAMMIIGFGLTGAAMRRSRRPASPAAA